MLFISRGAAGFHHLHRHRNYWSTKLQIARMNNNSLNKKDICLLKPIESDEEQLNEIYLKPGKNVIGRCKETGIRDTRCSKRQLELDVDFDKKRAKIRILGVNPCGINGIMVMKDSESQELKNGDYLEIVYGKHQYELCFPDESISNSANESLSDVWDSINNGKALIYTSAGTKSSEKIAGYDIDGTIIRTKSGNVFPKNIDDWEINYPEIPAKLKRLHENGFKICFFTNQAGIDKGKVDVNDFKRKITLIVKKLGVPVQVFIAVSDGYYRKPRPGMWEYMRKHKNDGIELDLVKCFFVGDAAGRPEAGSGSSKRRKDHSLADRLFAANVGIAFYTPEEHFLNKKTEAYNPPDFEPLQLNEESPVLEPESAKLKGDDDCEMVIMVGLPGSGKSHFAQEFLGPLGYSIINADTLHGVSACLKAAERDLKSGQPCVIDNTNVDMDSRKKFVDLAKQYKVPCRCFVMNVPLGHIKHNLAYRHLTDTKHSHINDMIFNGMKKKFKEPTVEEGFTEVVRVNFKPKFNNDEDKDLYKMYLAEK